jgi:hypothetical protein
MRTSELLHFAFRARDPLALGSWYAELFDGHFILHPIMCGLGIVLVKLNHPEAVFHGALEFWPWDLVWDGQTAAFRRVEPQPSPISYGHMALMVPQTTATIVEELERRGIAYQMEPRSLGFSIPVISDPEGNMVELFPNMAHIELPPGAICPPAEAPAAIAAIKAQLEPLIAGRKPSEGIPLLLFEQAAGRGPR